MGKKVLFVFNLHSGKGLIKAKISDILDELSKMGYETIAYSTQSAGDAKRQVLKYADSLDIMLCAGGDGTVSDAAAGIIESGRDIPLVFIPCGSTNDYGTTLNVSKKPLESIDRMAAENFKAVDIGKFNDSYFNYIAAFGLLTDIAYTTDQNLKNIMGYGAYLIEVAKRLFNIPVINATIETEEGKTYSDGWFYGMITNSTQVAGLKNITGDVVRLDDGLFEVTLIRATHNPIEFIEAFTSLTKGADSKFIERFKSRKITVRSDEPIAWTLDGEPGGEHTLVNIENLHQAVKIAVKKGYVDEIFEERGVEDETDE